MNLLKIQYAHRLNNVVPCESNDNDENSTKYVQ
jgi:hypothetical protein